MIPRSSSDDSSSTASSAFFSPISISFFNQRTKQQHLTPASAERLPPLHDSSWIGARLSPIGSFDREHHSEDDDDDDGHEQDEELQQSAADKENQRKHGTANSLLLHQQLSTARFVVPPNEHTSLLGKNNQSHPDNNILMATIQNPSHDPLHPAHSSNSSSGPQHLHQRNNNNNKNTSSKIHPLWNSPPEKRTSSMANRSWACCKQRFHPYCTFGVFLSVFSGLHLASMGIYDLWGWYQESQETAAAAAAVNQEQDTASASVDHAWSLPWLIPSQSTLIHFGALAPNNQHQNYHYGDDGAFYYYYRNYIGILSSLVVSTSATEWLLVAGAWRLLHISSRRYHRQFARQQQRRRSSNDDAGSPTTLGSSNNTATTITSLTFLPWHEFGGMFIASALTGQLWMYAFDGTENLVTGTAAFGTCGVLCAVGMVRPLHRFELFVLATMFLFVSLFQRPFGSVWGATGSAFFGWALGAAGNTMMERLPSYFPAGNGNDQHGSQVITFMGTASALLILLLPVFSFVLRGYY